MEFDTNAVYLTVKDHSVSGETFTLLINEELQLLKTSPQPAIENLGRYYESEDYISHTDSKRSLMEKLYHLVRRKALKDKVKIIEKALGRKGALLDIGAGTGDFLVTAKSAGWAVAGYEPNSKARSIAEGKGISFAASIEAIADNTYDMVTMWHVLEHVPDVEKQIAQLKRIVKHDGVIIIAVPNYKSFDAQHYGTYWAAYDVPRHLWHFSATAIKRIFGAQGLQVVEILPMKFDSYYVSLLSEKYKTGKMNYPKAFLTGWQSNRAAARSGEYSSLIYVIKSAENQNKAI